MIFKNFILFGHGVTNINSIDSFIDNLHMPFNEFKNMIEVLENFNYSFIGAEQLIKISKDKFKYDKPFIHITFDDGYKNNFDVVYPYLKSKNIPFSIYISTWHIENKERFYTYKLKTSIKYTHNYNLLKNLMEKYKLEYVEDFKINYKSIQKIYKSSNKEFQNKIIDDFTQLLDNNRWLELNDVFKDDDVLSIEQLNVLQNDPLVYIGSHNDKHILLNENVSLEDAKYEMQISKQWIKNNLNFNTDIYCFPNGTKRDFSKKTMNISQEVGYKIGLTTEFKYLDDSTNVYSIPRIPFRDTKVMKRIILLSILGNKLIGYIRIIWSKIA